MQSNQNLIGSYKTKTEECIKGNSSHAFLYASKYIFDNLILYFVFFWVENTYLVFMLLLLV